jgi:hypothetical protein
VKIAKYAGAVVATALTLGIGTITAPPASATDNIKIFGEQMRINYRPAVPMIGYTVTNFGPSTAPVGHAGTLYEATLTVQAFGSAVNPNIDRFYTRAESGAGNPAIVYAPGGINGAQLPPGGRTTGMLYFDVIGDVPNSVVYNDGTRDILAWVPGTIPLEGFPVEPTVIGPSESEVMPDSDNPGEASGGAMPAESTGDAGAFTPAPVEGFAEPLTPAEAGLPGFRN